MSVSQDELARLHSWMASKGTDYQTSLAQYANYMYNSSSRKKKFSNADAYLTDYLGRFGHSWEATKNKFMEPHNQKIAAENKLAEQKAQHAQQLAREKAAAEARQAAAKKEADRIAAENAARQREVQRNVNYGANMRSGDLAGPENAPNIIRGGSQNVDTSRLNVGSDTSRRRRGRGIQSQLGL